MAPVALDTNVLVYALLERATDKGDLARRILARTNAHDILAVQALVELLAVTRRQRPDQLSESCTG